MRQRRDPANAPNASARAFSIVQVAFIVLLTLAGGASASAQSGRNGAHPGPIPLFPSSNWWNSDIRHAPVDRDSDAYIARIGRDHRLHPNFGGNSHAPSEPIYGIPFIVVSGSQPLVRVYFDYWDESDDGAPGRPIGYPIPPQAKHEQRWIEGGLAGDDPHTHGDRHMLILDRDHRLLFELYALRWNRMRNRWDAGSGAVFSLNDNRRRPEGWTSADAAGLAILPGLVRYDEVIGEGPIRHAFRVTLDQTNGYVFPASHGAEVHRGAPPMGARLRLKASKDLSSYPPTIRKIFDTMKTYGLIVADNGPDLSVTGTYDTRWNNDVVNPAFESLKASDFEVIELGWKP